MKNVNIDIEYSKLIDIFAGTTFFGEWKVFIRELLQNAYDACHMKQALDSSWGTEFLELETARSLNEIRASYNPMITVSYDSNSKLFEVEDNGFGINEEDLQKYLVNIGESYYNSDDFAIQKVDFVPSSSHGVGLFSCLAVSRAILIESKKDKAINTAWNVSNVQSLEGILVKWHTGDYNFEYVKSERTTPGTKISLYLKNEYASKMSADFLIDTVRYYTMYQPVPIRVIYDGVVKVLALKKPKWNIPYVDAVGVKTIRVDTDLLEGFIVVYNSRYRRINLKSELFQLNFRLTDDVDALKLKPNWLSNCAFYINIKTKLLNLNYGKNYILSDENLTELRKQFGLTIINYFSNDQYGLNQYLASGNLPMIPPFKRERDLLCRFVNVSVYYKGKIAEAPISTILKEFEGRTARIAVIQKSLFNYYKSGYAYDFKKFESGHDIVFFEHNINILKQFIAPYFVSHKHTVSETPGVIYTDIFADFKYKNDPYADMNFNNIRPIGCDFPPVFCLVSNEYLAPMEIIINSYNRNAQLLMSAHDNEKVKALENLIIENIKRRIIAPKKKRWDKIIDFGGTIIEEWDSDTSLSLQSVWCLESDFANMLNVLVAERLTPREIAEYGLAGLYFTDDDFISWWLPPK